MDAIKSILDNLFAKLAMWAAVLGGAYEALPTLVAQLTDSWQGISALAGGALLLVRSFINDHFGAKE